MAKNSNYFPHDSQMRNMDELQPLLMKLGARGYGVYIMLLERLRDCEQYEDRAGYDVVAYTLHEDVETVRTVVEDFGLFELTETGYTSPWLCSKMTKMDDISKKRTEAVAKRLNRAQPDEDSTNVLQNSTNVLQKNRFVQQKNSVVQQKNSVVQQNFTNDEFCSGNNKIKNKNKNIKSSSDDDDGRASASPSTPPPEKEIIFCLADAAARWGVDTVWLASVSSQTDMPPAAVGAMLTSFVDRCRAEGKTHTDERDARSHFFRWLKTSDGRKELKRLASRVVAPPKTSAKPCAHNPEPYTPPPRGVKAEEMIRRWGYDPEKVTMSQACNPNWRKENPPGVTPTTEP